ncbi:ROK family protein [Aerococcaceae bacterium zg-ZJ1578]|uniref:ROK family protein n=1 Tax=Aerococcaceae bacterium zg-252 TaxID=2796928 RepID=UPI001A1F9784|nr:ROK family protein [Aerococcaceae bacterium zg-1578]MBS4462520.1 ROK family protein [Aerococcaceae bacterium zg-B36]
MSYLGIDIGGTFIKYALLDEQGEALTETYKVKTHCTESTNYILEQVIAICEEMQAKYDFKGVAVGTAGVVNSSDGSIAYAGYTIPEYTGTPIKRQVESATGRRCTVINDVNAACLGEYWKGFGQANRPQSLVCLTIGTGVGGAVLIDGHLYEGSSYMAGEVGYLPLANGKMFQDAASTTALLAQAESALGYQVSGEQFFELLAANDEKVQVVFDSFIDSLAQGLLTIHYLLNPEQIVLGGGVLAQKAVILPALTRRLSEIVIDQRFLSAKISAAQLGNNAGMLGALYYHLHEAN